MSKKYENIMVAVDGSHEAELAFEKGVNVALRNGSKLTLAHVVDTRALQSVSTFDAEVMRASKQKQMNSWKTILNAQKMLVSTMLLLSLKWEIQKCS